jgi:serine/threonine protein kinase
MPLSAPVPIGTTLENRYEVVRFLGHGGFGRTYLVKDQHRFHEFCVLKEFAPQVSQPEVIQKAEELFQREAGTLYKLTHPQIPEFRAMSSVLLNGEKVVFLVEQFIDGYNYGEWVEQGHCLSPAQALRLLHDLLPVLTYIHSQGVIHRDIAPDNIMCDRLTNKPILIDFGSVKQVAQTALNLVNVGMHPPTQIQKLGYTPIEQIKGNVHPNSDIYALAVTVLVLMTGQPPQELFDAHTQAWQWEKFVTIEPRFSNVLHRMLARHTHDRYRTAAEVLQAIGPLHEAGPIALAANPMPVTLMPAAIPVATPAPMPRPIGTAPYRSSVKTVAVAPAWNPPPPTQLPAPVPPAGSYSAHNPVAPSPYTVPPGIYVPPRPADRGNWLGRSIKAVIFSPFRLLGWLLKLLWGGIRVVDMMFTWIFRLVLIAGIVGVASIFTLFGKPDWLPNIALPDLNLPGLPSLPTLPTFPTVSRTARGCQDLAGRATRVGLTTAQVSTEVNQKFYKRYPDLRNRALTDRVEDQPMREAWCEMADEFLARSESR